MHDAASLIDYAERPRAGGWSLRSALVRYAQPEPARAGAVLELVRRTDGALKPFVKVLDDSPDLDAGDETLVGLLAAASALDRLGDVLAGWADSSPGDHGDRRPDRDVDDIARRVFGILGDLGVEREARTPRRS